MIPDVAAFVETNLEIEEKIATSGYTWVGKNKQHKKGGGVDYFIKNTIKNSCAVEPDNNATTEILDQAKIKKARKLIYRCFIWKTRQQTLHQRIRRRI